MSIKNFHLVFILLSVGICVYFGKWAIQEGQTLTGIISFLLGVGLLIYGVQFRKKLKHLSLFIGFLLMNLPNALACTVCFGNPNDLMTKGLQSGIFFLLGILAFVLGSFAVFFLGLRKRAKIIS